MRLVIFGASGPTGLLLTENVRDAGHTVVAVTRHPDEFPVRRPGLTVIGADVRTGTALSDVVHGADVVLSMMGQAANIKRIDLYSIGIANIITAMQQATVRRLIVVSSTGVDPDQGRRNTPWALRVLGFVITRTLGRTTYIDMRRMEALVRGSGLDWTIVRPSTLFNHPRVTEYVAGEVDAQGIFTARSDLADYLAALITARDSIGRTVVVSTTHGAPTVPQTLRGEPFRTT
jgi:putative NADH-flavin reductase